MKHRVRRMIAAGGLVGVSGIAAAAGAQTPVREPAAYLAQCKAVFENACGVCHGLERALSKTFDRAGWERTVERMHDNGAEASGAERAQIVSYLLTKNSFEEKCSVCHGTDRSLGEKKSAGDWLATVQRMSAKKPGHLTEAEAAQIAAYLSVACPLP